MGSQSVSTSFIGLFSDYISQNGYEDAEVLAEIERIRKAYPQRTPEPKFIEIYRRIADLHPKPGLAFLIGMTGAARHYGIIGHIATSCSTLQDAFAHCLPYQNLFDESLDVRVIDGGDQVKLDWWGDNPDIVPEAAEIGMASFVNFYQLLIGEHIPPLQIEFPFSAHDPVEVCEAIMGCPVLFDAEAVSITLSKSLILKNIATRDPYLKSLFERQAKAILDSERGDDAFIKYVRQAIREQLMQSHLADQTLSAEHVAKRLNVSLRTFYRRLRLLNIRFRSLLADTRLSIAKSYLNDQELPLSQVALMLGYSDQSAFSRAFIAWTGETPSAYRKRLESEMG